MIKQDALTVYIGWDPKEPAASAVLAHSILRRAEKPVYLMPLTRKAVSHVYTRPRGPLESTDFSMTRFLVPYLNGYQGHALFLDCDMLCLTDVWHVMLYALADPGQAVYVAQHDYTPREGTKFLGQPQTAYPRKNWSSAMLFDCARCTALTPEYVNTATGLELHRLLWADERIGSLPLAWNWLVGEYPVNADAKILHWTQGGPWFPDYAYADYAGLWFDELADMLGTTPRELIGVR
jgi:hypothetical protein